MAKTDWAIVVGVTTYPGLGDLAGPENDARAFHQWLVCDSGGAVPKKQAKLIISSKFNPPFRSTTSAKPTLALVQEAFDTFLDVAQEHADAGDGLQVGRRLYLYFAGHGFAPQLDQTVLLMANATRERAGYHVAGPPYADWFFRSGYFTEVILFMDCCRESYPKIPLNVPAYIDVTAPDAVDVGRRFFGFGTKWSRLSRERPMNDGMVRGVFTTALIDGLRGKAVDLERPADTDGVGDITAASLCDYMYNNMKTYLSEADLQNPDVPKDPEFVVDPAISQSFVIARAPKPDFGVTIQLPAAAAGQQVEIVDGSLETVTSTAAVPPAWQLRLPRGRYLALIPAIGAKHRFDVLGTGDVDVRLVQ